ncbi:MAG: argininosuccinate lyase [Candidatus Poribacteria bacterium]|nr:MAG: argininosuccinate lyase [Candidatus Poribacteria bacterium]
MIGAWGQRRVENLVLRYTESTRADERLVPYDIWGSQAHALMLARQGLLTEEELRRILAPLETAFQDYLAGKLILDPQLEDVHMNVEQYVTQAAGKAFGGKLHTARSRNDQVLTDARLYVREALLEVEERLCQLIDLFLRIAQEHIETVMPGYTHTQHAQPITLGFWATGHGFLLLGDLRRLQRAYETTNRSPLGACALAGTNLPIDRQLTAWLLGFDSVETHALAVVSGRDFIWEAAFALATLAVNCSRLAEEIVLWSTYEFRMISLADEYALGSSIMPQKKNPDLAELARGRSGKAIARLQEVLTLLKALPLGYHRDLQEDKPPLWEAFDGAIPTLEALSALLETAQFHPERMRQLVQENFSTATELANYLVQKRNVPFREAHGITGRVVAALAAAGRTFEDLEACAKALEAEGYPIAREELRRILDPLEAVRRNRTEGGTGPESVRQMIKELQWQLQKARSAIAERRNRIAAARERTRRCVQGVLQGEPLATVWRAVGLDS